MINISIVIPTYNRPQLLNRAIRSVLRQKDENLSLEIVVIDDCSLEKVNLSEFKDYNVLYKRLDINSGPSKARNEGIALATGDWIIMLDDDDEFVDNAFDKIFESIQSVYHHKNYPVFFFATSNGSIPNNFQFVSAREILNKTLKGDFTPIIQRTFFIKSGLRYLEYPEIVGVGCESLTWLYIGSKFYIPTFQFHIVKVNADAPISLTSYENAIKNSLKFAIKQDISIDFVKQNKLDNIHPPFISKKYLGAAIYYLLSGEKTTCRERLKIVKQHRPITSTFICLLSKFPVPTGKFFFRLYKMKLC